MAVYAMRNGLGSIDLSTLSWEDYLLLGIGGAMVYSLVFPDSGLLNPSPPKRKRRKKSSSGNMASLGVVLTLAAVGVAGYYVWTKGSALGASLAQESLT